MKHWVVYLAPSPDTPGVLPHGAGSGTPDGVAFGTLDGDQVQPHAGDMFHHPKPVGAALPLASLTLVAPVRPRHFIGLWNNFHALAEKQGNAIPETPLWFLKAPGSIIGPEATIRPPAGYTGKTLYEGELGIVIGHGNSIFGYTCINDVTALDLLTADPSFPQWARAKSCATFGPIGPAIATGLDWRDLTIRVALNGRERQSYPARDIIIPPERIVELISREMALHPGDVIACGTSIGALPMRAGMVVEVTIDGPNGGIGTLRNTMAEAG